MQGTSVAKTKSRSTAAAGKAKRGGQTTFSHEKANAVCRQLAMGATLRAVCRKPGMPPESTVRLWALEDRHGFAAQYAGARELGYYAMADEMLEIADDASGDVVTGTREDGTEFETVNHEVIARSRLRVDTRKWALSKALPKVFGDKLDVTSGGKPVVPILNVAQYPDEAGPVVAQEAVAGAGDESD